MHDVLKCEHIIRYFAKTDRSCKLLLTKWHVIKEMKRILHVPYLTTLMLQKNEFTLSDFFGCLQILTMQFNKIIAEPGRKYTSLAEKLLQTLSQRKKKLVDNPLMICALYLDPRYKCEVENNQEKVMLAKLTLENLWERVKIAKGEEIIEVVLVDVEEATEENMNVFYEELDKLYDDNGQSAISASGCNVPRLNLNQGKASIATALSKYESSTMQRMKSSESIWAYWE